MRWRATFQVPGFDRSAYLALLHKSMTAVVQQTAREWIKATLFGVPIPVWSGASAATFNKLAAKVAYPLNLLPERGVTSRISLGIDESEGEIVANPKGDYHFEYATSLAHLIYNEFNNANVTPDPTLFAQLIQPGPYHFQEAGRRAFQAFAADVRLPSPRRFFRRRKIRVR